MDHRRNPVVLSFYFELDRGTDQREIDDTAAETLQAVHGHQLIGHPAVVANLRLNIAFHHDAAAHRLLLHIDDASLEKLPLIVRKKQLERLAGNDRRGVRVELLGSWRGY